MFSCWPLGFIYFDSYPVRAEWGIRLVFCDQLSVGRPWRGLDVSSIVRGIVV